MAEEKFFTGNISKAYAKARPAISNEGRNKVIEFMKEKLYPPYELLVDIGCGTGQSTLLFSAYFDHVYGVDSSQTQIEEAKANHGKDNITYSIGDAHSLPSIDSNSVSMIISIEAAHWFDLPKFFQECDRILKPNGVIALFGYLYPTIHCAAHPECDDQLFDVIQKFQNHLIDSKVISEIPLRLLENDYRDIELPYKEQKAFRNDPSVYTRQQMNISTAIEFLSSFSPYRELKRRKLNDTSLENAEKEMLSIIPNSSKETTVEMIYPWFIVMCRKPAIE